MKTTPQNASSLPTLRNFGQKRYNKRLVWWKGTSKHPVKFTSNRVDMVAMLPDEGAILRPNRHDDGDVLLRWRTDANGDVEFNGDCDERWVMTMKPAAQQAGFHAVTGAWAYCLVELATPEQRESAAFMQMA